MSLTQKFTQIDPFPNPKPSKPSKTPKPFDETLIRRLTSLLKSSPEVTLSFLTLAVDLLSETLTSFSALLSDPNLSRCERDVEALSSHLDASAALLDAVNSVTAAVDRLSRRRLHLSFGLHLLSHRPLTPELTRKARDSIAEWNEEKTTAFSAGDLIRGDAPRGKVSAVQRSIYAVEALSALVIGLASSLLGAKADLEKVSVSNEFSWSEAFNGVVTAVNGKIGGSAAEIEAVDSIVKKLKQAVDNGKITEELRSLTEEAEKKTDELTEGIDRLTRSVNGLFRAGLCARNAALQGFRIGPEKCK